MSVKIGEFFEHDFERLHRMIQQIDHIIKPILLFALEKHNDISSQFAAMHTDTLQALLFHLLFLLPSLFEQTFLVKSRLILAINFTIKVGLVVLGNLGAEVNRLGKFSRKVDVFCLRLAFVFIFLLSFFIYVVVFGDTSHFFVNHRV